MTGFITSILVNIWLSMGTILYGKKPKAKLFSQENCIIANLTNSTSSKSFSTVNVLNFSNSTLKPLTPNETFFE